MGPTPADDALVLKQCQRDGDESGLWQWIRRHCGVALPYKAFTPGHSTPLAFLADAFFNPDKDVAAWANRSGIKTLGASILAAMEFAVNDRLQARVLSGSEDQGRNLYRYWQQWCGGPLARRLEGDVEKLLTKVGGGRFEILAASQKKVRGGKVQRLYEDELDEVDPEIDEAAVGMIDSRRGIAGRTVYTSTWHHVDGPMGRLIDAAPDNGVMLHKWNLWESIERCPEERHDNGRSCEHCTLVSTCLGKARDFHADPEWRVGIAAEATGLYRIEDAIKAVRKVSQATWDAEYLCKRPCVAGLVYPEFDALTHKCASPPADLAMYRVVDWGYNVFCCLWIGQDKEGRAYVLDTYRAETGTIQQHAKFLSEHRLQKIKATYCDPAGRNTNDQTGKSNVQLFKARGIECSYTLSPKLREVRNGVQMVRGMLRSATGEIRLFYVPNENNKAFVRAMQSYHNRKVNGIWIDNPTDPQDFEHVPDALRYFVVNRQAPKGIGRVQLGAK